MPGSQSLVAADGLIWRGAKSCYGRCPADGFRTFAGTGTVAIGRFAVAGATLPLFDVSATAAIVAGDGSASGWSVGANAALLNSLQVGAGYTRTASITRLHIPLSAVLPVAACVDAQRALILYGAPIWNFEHISAQLGDRWEPSWSSFSAGVVLELPSGIGIQAGGGKPFHHAPDPTYDRWSFSIGVHISRHSLVHSTPSKDYGCHALL